MKIKTKLTLGFALIVTVSVLSVGGMTIYSQRQHIKSQIHETYHQMSGQLAKVSQESLVHDDLVFFNFVEALKQENGVVSALFVDDKGRIQLHSNPDKIDSFFQLETGIKDFSKEVRLGQDVVGRAHLWVSEKAIKTRLDQATVQDLKRIGIISLGVLIISLILAFLFSRTMTRPIHDLVQGMRQISKGRRNLISFPKRKDELGWMGEELNATIEKLNEVDELKRDFAAAVTHDLKSPLNVLQTIHSTLLRRKNNLSNETLQDYHLTAQNNANRLMKLIDNLLAVARIEGHKEEFNCKLFDVRNIAKEIIQLNKPIADEKGMEFTVNFPSNSTYVWADPEKTFQIISNLVSNAFKFTKDGSIKIDITDNKEGVKIRVKDSGPGIPKEDRDKIFDKFQRSTTHLKLAKGTGLGLFIVKSYVEALGGSVSVKDNHPKGTIFEFTLPKTKAA